ncbi:MAG: histidine kinase, partial [Bacteroidales bacterium]|nr:histidine kinase [Bacteroidales bacterium]
SIQHYIIQQDEENANLYLSKFAALIRRILENSKKKLISLSEEIDTLSLYLKLEKLRFEDKFTYQIHKSHDLDQHVVMVPPMIIQPFVENAIWHGLTPLESGGVLKIDFSRTGDIMKVTIEDNGIGRAQALKVKRPPGHISTGLKNVNERLLLLNKLSNQSINCDIIDLSDDDGNAIGTRVELSIPISLEHE